MSSCGNCCPSRMFVTDEICGSFDTTDTTVPLTVYSQDSDHPCIGFGEYFL